MQTECCLIEVISSSPEETGALGERIARKLQPGSVVAISGGLGAGKTCLAKGIAKAAGIAGNITSPTYTILNEYPGEVPFFHIDAYRLGNDEDFEHTGAGECMDAGGITVIEWSDRIPRSIPENAIKIRMAISSRQERIIRIEGIGIE